MERKVKIPRFNERDLYPNLYVMLIGKPGSGKTTAMTEVYNLLSAVGVKLAPKSTTSAALYDAVLASVKIINNGTAFPLIYSSLSCIVDELAVWMPQYDNGLHGILCSLWDNPIKHDEGRRTTDSKPLENPQLNMLVGVQPAYLGSILPVSAHEMGLVTRCLLVYCHERPVYELTFGESNIEAHDTSYSSLLAGLKRIHTLMGAMQFSEAAKDILRDFHANERGIEDLKFEHYNTRRIVSIAKLGMIASASMGNSKIVDAVHLDWAIRSLKQIEVYMPEVYKEMGKPETSKIMAEVFSWVFQKFMETRQPIQEQRILHVLESKVPIRDIQPTLKAMLDLRMLKKTEGPKSAMYEPVAENKRLD